MNLESSIQDRSEKTADATGKPAVVLREKSATEIAAQYGVPLRDIYRKALEMGVWPLRYFRNLGSFTTGDQLKLSDATIAVIGAGGLGGHVILLLARMGVGCLKIADHDTFEETNLNRQALATVANLELPKAKAAADMIRAVNPAVEVSLQREKFCAENGDAFLVGADLVIDALDNIPDRFTVEKFAKKHGIPMVHGALSGWEGRLMSILPGDKGLALLYGDEKQYSERKSSSPEAVLGVPALIPAALAAFLAMEAVKIILGRGTLFRNAMAYLDMEKGQLQQFDMLGDGPAEQQDANDV